MKETLGKSMGVGRPRLAPAVCREKVRRAGFREPLTKQTYERDPLLGFIIYLIIIGIIAGYLARLLVPGRDDIGFARTVVLGIVGSFIGGFLGYLIFGEDFGEGGLQASGIIGSLIGAIIALLIYRAMNGAGTPKGPSRR